LACLLGDVVRDLPGAVTDVFDSLSPAPADVPHGGAGLIADLLDGRARACSEVAGRVTGASADLFRSLTKPAPSVARATGVCPIFFTLGEARYRPARAPKERARLTTNVLGPIRLP
jgi:hypothetical protein